MKSSTSMMSWPNRLAMSCIVLAMGGAAAFAQSKMVSGTIVDDLGEPIAGANVVIVGTTTGVITDANGKFTLKDVPSSAKLKISFLGYAEQVVPANQSDFNITLKEDFAELDEVVMIGYQSVKRRDLTGSVASVSNKQLTAVPVSDVSQALQGKLSGVNVVAQDGRPDASVSIRVRGGGSISQSNEPLILIDGVVGTLSDVPAEQVESIDVLKDASSTAIYGARGANGVILVTTKRAKEGRATITYNGYAKWNTPTKYIDVLSPYDYISYIWANASAQDNVDYTAPIETLFGLSGGGLEKWKNVSAYDVQKEVYDNSFSHNHDLSVTGGTGKTRYILSLGYNDEEGMKVNSYRRRTYVSGKIDQKYNKNLDFGLDFRYAHVETMSDESTTSGQGSILSSAFKFRPISTADIERLGDPAGFKQGAIAQYGKQWLWDMYNPARRAEDYEPLKVRQNLRATGTINWKIISGLAYRSELTLRRTWQQNKIWSGPVYNNYLDESTGEALYAGAATLYKGDSWGLRWTNTLNYDLEINENNHLNVLAGHEMTNSGGNSMTITADYFPANFTKENAFAMINQYDKTKSTITSPFSSGYTISERITSFFGRVNYSLMDRYLLTFTMRADGSSKFAPGNLWGFFPAGAVAWRLNEEPFMESTEDLISNVKVRASYGTVGNDGISAALWSQTWTGASAANRQYSIGKTAQSSYDLASTTMANPDLKWETTITRNIGIDWGIMDNRFNGAIDIYKNSTKDLLMLTTLPDITGFTATYDNIGETSNRGVEISVNAAVIQKKDFNLYVGANINFNKNKVEELAPGVNGIYGTQWFSQGNPGNDMILKEGKPVGLVRGLKYDGFYTTDDFTYDPATNVYTLKEGVPDVSANITGVVYGVNKYVPSGQNAYPGMAKYVDVDGSGVVDTEDYDIIGDMNPKHTGGFSITGNWKAFDFGVYFNWSYGNEIYNVNKMASLMGYKENGVFQNKMAMMAGCYKIYDLSSGSPVRVHDPESLNALNANATLPLCYNESGTVSTLGIEDGSYLRLNTLTLGYTLPKNLIAKAGITNLRVYGTIYNLFTITGYDGLDPEVSTNGNMNNSEYPTPGLDWGAYPHPRSFVLGLNVSF